MLASLRSISRSHQPHSGVSGSAMSVENCANKFRDINDLCSSLLMVWSGGSGCSEPSVSSHSDSQATLTASTTGFTSKRYIGFMLELYDL